MNTKTESPKRQMHRFWLSNRKPEEAAVNDMIPVLKRERRFAKAVRDGLRLVIALTEAERQIQAGVGQPQVYIQVLRLLFPNVVRLIEQSAANQELLAMRAQLETMSAQIASGSTPAPVSKPRAAVPTVDLVVNKAGAGNTAANLLNSFKMLAK
ncbi:MAG: hypothetical protein JNJ61_25695 [Anaerolineae bacterium]|nr:hypothetical protein [Anaerolineae bacterium]